MNDKQKAWLDKYIECGDAVKAVELVYTDIQRQSRATKASYLKNTLADEINKRALSMYAPESVVFMNEIKRIALNSKQDAVRLKACSEWLSRTPGHNQAIEVKDVTEEATHEQLLERLKIATQGIDPKLLAGVLPKELLTHLEKDDNAERTTATKETTTH